MSIQEALKATSMAGMSNIKVMLDSIVLVSALRSGTVLSEVAGLFYYIDHLVSLFSTISIVLVLRSTTRFDGLAKNALATLGLQNSF
ncbi:hypothetical protein Bca101_079256 [Brassica carinata]